MVILIFKNKIIQLKINPKMVFTFHKNNLEMFEQLKKFISSGFFKIGSGNTMRLIVTDKQEVIKSTELMVVLELIKSLLSIN
jgi:hypothetical protein